MRKRPISQNYPPYYMPSTSLYARDQFCQLNLQGIQAKTSIKFKLLNIKLMKNSENSAVRNSRDLICEYFPNI